MDAKHEETYSPEYQRQIRYQFESFCRKVIHSERCDYLRRLLRRMEYETNFSALPEAWLDSMGWPENWSENPYTFYACGYSIPIQDMRLIEALLEFDDTERSILLLFYSLKLSDKIIGGLLHLSRSRVQQRRTRLLLELRKKMKE